MGPRRNTEKAKDFKTSVKKLIKYCKNFLPTFIIAGVLAIAGAILAVIGPNKLSDLTNEITSTMMTGINFDSITGLALILLLIYCLSSIFSSIQGYIMAGATQKISKKLRKDINEKVNKLPLAYIDSNSYGDMMSRMTNDVDTISQGFSHSISSLIGAITLLIACLIMMFITNWIMAFTAIGSSLIGFVLVAIIMSKSQKYFRQQQKSLGDVNGHIEESFSGHDIITVYNATGKKKEQFSRFNTSLYSSTWKSQFLGGVMPNIMFFIGNFGYVAVCVVGAVLVTQNMISIGTIVAFMLYVRLFSNPLTQIAHALNHLQSSAAASERVFGLLEEKEIRQTEKIKPINLKKIKGNVEFKNVKFGYTDKIIIHDFSANIKAGQKVAIVGPTGAGKTTLVNLLMRFYEINSGSIKIDGTDIKNIDRSDLHNIFGMVLQDTWLFEGTVKENLVYNQEGIDDEKLAKICETCGLTHFIKTLPRGLDTVLDDNTNISQGQKQLLTIARAMIQNCPMLILDEATSSIDTRIEATIQKAIDRLTKDRTSFVIAHRLSTIKNADLILVLKDGDIVEQGNHKKLLAKKGFYADLYNSQFQDNN